MKKIVKRTKVTRPDGTSFVSVDSPATLQAIYTDCAVTEVTGYDVKRND